MTLPEALPAFSDIWRWNTQSSLPPINGQVRTDTAEWTEATNLYINNITDSGLDQGAQLMTIVASDEVVLEMKTDATRFARYTATADAIDCGTYVQVPVVYQDGAGGLPNAGTQIVLSASPDSSRGTVALWTMLPDGATHYWSQVTCPHGTTQSGVWLVRPIQDDRNFLESMDPTFANHQALHPECDCTLKQDWDPTYMPPPPDNQPDELEMVAQESSATPTAGSATFGLQVMRTGYWYAEFVRCQHGESLHGVWTNNKIPDVPSLQAEAYQNHLRLFGCSDPLAPPPSHVALTLQGGSVPAGGSMVMVQNAPTSISGVFAVTNGTLTVSAAAMISVQLSMKVQSLNPNVGGARLLVAGQSVASAPFVLLPLATNVKATIVWSGLVAAGAPIQVAYDNTSSLPQNLTNGANLSADEVFMQLP